MLVIYIIVVVNSFIIVIKFFNIFDIIGGGNWNKFVFDLLV